jgi:hypothetical protein
MSLTDDLDRFTAACAYRGKLDELAVERELASFLQALGVSRRIVRLRAGRRPEDDAPINRNIDWWIKHNFGIDITWILVECIKRNFGVRAFHDVPAPLASQRLRATLADDAGVAFEARTALAARRTSDAVAAVGRFIIFDRRAARAVSTACLLGIGGPLAGVAFAAYPGATLAALAGASVAAIAALADRANRARLSAYFAEFGPQSEARALRANWWRSTWELSWSICALFGAVERTKPAIETWGRPLFEAFVCGCWLLYWAKDTLYWVAKPTVHCEPGTQRLHHDTRAALESDIVNLYFWHGVIVPPFVILRPDLITIAHIDQETNAEIRRVLIERYRRGEEIHGAAAFIRDAGGERLDYDERYGTLWRRNFFVGAGDERRRDDEPIVMIEVVNRTPEPDGSFKHYWLRVPPEMRTAREAVAWTFNMPAGQYAPERET